MGGDQNERYDLCDMGQPPKKGGVQTSTILEIRRLSHVTYVIEARLIRLSLLPYEYLGVDCSSKNNNFDIKLANKGILFLCDLFGRVRGALTTA